KHGTVRDDESNSFKAIDGNGASCPKVFYRLDWVQIPRSSRRSRREPLPQARCPAEDAVLGIGRGPANPLSGARAACAQAARVRGVAPMPSRALPWGGSCPRARGDPPASLGMRATAIEFSPSLHSELWEG